MVIVTSRSSTPEPPPPCPGLRRRHGTVGTTITSFTSSSSSTKVWLVRMGSCLTLFVMALLLLLLANKPDWEIVTVVPATSQYKTKQKQQAISTTTTTTKSSSSMFQHQPQQQRASGTRSNDKQMTTTNNNNIQDAKNSVSSSTNKTNTGVLSMDDLKDLSAFYNNNSNSNATSSAATETTTIWEQEAALRQPILQLLQHAGLDIDLSVLQSLPTWQQVVDLYGEQPIIVGKETCEIFRNKIPPTHRFVGVAGQMNTGTNALAKYLRNNLKMPDNPILKGGMLWTVPWYKHAWASLRHKYMYRLPDEHETVMPVVVIRDAYFWMNSMCESPYSMEWNHSSNHCPNLVEENVLMEYDNNEEERQEQQQQEEIDTSTTTTTIPAHLGVPVWIRWARWGRQWPSLAHVWTSWYQEYLHADFPRLIIRFEDLLFHTETVLEEIKECVGAEWVHDTFVYQTQPAKTHPYFESFKKQSGLISALIKYGHDRGQRTDNMTLEDLEYAQQFVSQELLELFHYQAPAVRP